MPGELRHNIRRNHELSYSRKEKIIEELTMLKVKTIIPQLFVNALENAFYQYRLEFLTDETSLMSFADHIDAKTDEMKESLLCIDEKYKLESMAFAKLLYLDSFAINDDEPGIDRWHLFYAGYKWMNHIDKKLFEILMEEDEYLLRAMCHVPEDTLTPEQECDLMSNYM